MPMGGESIERERASEQEELHNYLAAFGSHFLREMGPELESEAGVAVSVSDERQGKLLRPRELAKNS